VKYLFGFLK